ncbi:MAG: hypothetical protein Q6J68_06490 [Thermostichales cyanobacterium SZTDM-1c_bins_54]
METALTNIMEYLALGELELQMSQLHQHQSLFHDEQERQALLQQILNRVPPVYMLLGEDETPSLSMISTPEQDYLSMVVRQQLEEYLKTRSSHGDPYSGMMTEMFY